MSNSHEGPADVAPGLVLARRYHLLRRLGSGGFGRVWLAHDDLLGVDVAVKEVQVPPGATATETEERVQRAAREARNAARLRDHPNIVSVHDVVIERGVPWMVMQYVAGRSLADEVRLDGPMPVPRASAVAASVLSALEACHAAGIIHRDVKPANIMLNTDGSVILTDFGIAKQAEQTSMTAQDTVIGSVEYMAPERARGLPATPASDLFSLGVTLYHVVEGVSPFKRGSGTATLSAVLLDDIPAPTRGGALTLLITALMKKDPDERPSVDQARAMLHGTAAPVAVMKTAQPGDRSSAETEPYAVALAATEFGRRPSQGELEGDSGRYGVKPVDRRVMLGAATAAGVAVVVSAAILSEEGSHGKDAPVSDSSSAAAAGGTPTEFTFTFTGTQAATPATVLASSVPVGGGVIISDQNIVITRPDSSTYKAFSAICTHLGCQVAQVEDNKITCPCHGSVFSARDGSVIQGPASQGLAAYPITVASGFVTAA